MIDKEKIVGEAMRHIERVTLSHPDIAGFIDSTIIKPDATEEEIRKVCEEAKVYGMRGVAVLPCYVKLASILLRGSTVKVIGVAGFPFGGEHTEVKAQQARMCVADGAQEIDMVMNIGFFKDKKYDRVVEDIRKVKNAIRPTTLLKVIIETPLLTPEEIVKVSLLVQEAGADVVKTGTGIHGPVTVDAVRIIKKACKLPVKAAGGIRTYAFASELIKAGAEIIGTSTPLNLLS